MEATSDSLLGRQARQVGRQRRGQRPADSGSGAATASLPGGARAATRPRGTALCDSLVSGRPPRAHACGWPPRFHPSPGSTGHSALQQMTREMCSRNAGRHRRWRYRRRLLPEKASVFPFIGTKPSKPRGGDTARAPSPWRVPGVHGDRGWSSALSLSISASQHLRRDLTRP